MGKKEAFINPVDEFLKEEDNSQEPEQKEVESEDKSDDKVVESSDEKPEDKQDDKKEEKEEKEEKDDLQTKYENLQKALRAEREQSKTTTAELADIRKKSERWEKIASALETAEKQQTQLSEQEKFSENPALYLKEGIDRLRTDMQTQNQTAEQQRSIENQFQSIAASAREFAAKQTDYLDAMKHVQDIRYKSYELYGIPQNQWEPMWNRECADFGVMQLRQGKDPAQMAYEYAKVNGYTGQKGSPDAKNKQKLESMQDGQKASRNLDGGTGDEEGSLIQKIDDMSDDEFDAYWKKIAKH